MIYHLLIIKYFDCIFLSLTVLGISNSYQPVISLRQYFILNWAKMFKDQLFADDFHIASIYHPDAGILFTILTIEYVCLIFVYTGCTKYLFADLAFLDWCHRNLLTNDTLEINKNVCTLRNFA